MPIYEFHCRSCGAVFEAIRPVGDRGESLHCPECGSPSPEKIYSTFATARSQEAACSADPCCGGTGRSFT